LFLRPCALHRERVSGDPFADREPRRRQGLATAIDGPLVLPTARLRHGHPPRVRGLPVLDTALGVMNTAPHEHVGEMQHERIIGALERCCRRGEMLLIQNKRINWDTCQIGILLANGITPKLGKGREDTAWNAEQVREIDLRWHDLRHEGACRLLSDGVDIRIIQLVLGHASAQQTQRYLTVTDEELRKGLEVSWKNQGRSLRLASGQ
jgi:integrase-like protein